MAKSKRKRAPKTVLKLPDLEQSKSVVLNSLRSASSKRSYEHAICEFIDWYCSEPRLAFKLNSLPGVIPIRLRGHCKVVRTPGVHSNRLGPDLAERRNTAYRYR